MIEHCYSIMLKGNNEGDAVDDGMNETNLKQNRGPKTVCNKWNYAQCIKRLGGYKSKLFKLDCTN